MTPISRLGRFEIRWDERYGSVVSKLVGYWDEEDVFAFYPALTSVANKSRAQHGKAFFLFDTRDFDVQSNMVIERHQQGPLVNSEDRAAIIVVSSLLRLQMMRARVEGLEREFFLTQPEAERWLYAS